MWFGKLISCSARLVAKWRGKGREHRPMTANDSYPNNCHTSSIFIPVRNLLAAIVLNVGLLSQAAHADIPAVKLMTAPGVAPASAWSYYGGSTTHTNGIAAWPGYAPEIAPLARSLGAGRLDANSYALNVRDYIRNNIAVEYRFGLGKGARGALIDQSGTPFDQAELMVKLLRYNGIAASYQMGTITLTAQQFGVWSGLVKGLNQSSQTFTVDAKAACQFLADGGIPATINGSSNCTSLTGDLSTVTLGHIWVSANGLLYDPSYKEHSLTSGIDLAAAMSCGSAGASTCGSQVSSAVLSGMTSTTVAGSPAYQLQSAPFVSAGGVLNAQAVTLQHSLQAASPFAKVADVVGGKALAPVPNVPGASFAYPSSVQATWSGEIPDQFRTTLAIAEPGCAAGGLFAHVFFADEIAGRRLSYSGTSGLANATVYNFYLDGTVAPPSSACAAASQPNQFVMDVNHPYAAVNGSYGDDHIALNLVEPARMRTGLWESPGTIYPPSTVETSIAGSFPVTIVHAFGNASTSAQKFMSDLQTVSPVMTAIDCRPGSTTPAAARTCENDKQPLAAETISPLRTLSSQIVAGVADVAITRHHDIGILYSSRRGSSSYVSVQEAESINSKKGAADGTAQSRAFEIEAATMSAVESRATSDEYIYPIDATKMFFTSLAMPINTGVPQKIYYSVNATSIVYVTGSANMQALLAGLPDTVAAGGYEPWRKTLLQAAADAGYATILAPGTDGELFLRQNSIAYTVWESLKGAAGGDNPVESALKTTDLVDAASLRRKEISISPASGQFTMTAAPDIVTGSGALPHSLAFTRTFQPAAKEIERTSHTDYVDVVGGTGAGATSRSYITMRGGADSDSYARLGGGWTHNFNITATGSSDPAKALGEDYALEASRTIATIVTLNDLLSNPSLSDRISSIFAMHQLSGGYGGLGVQGSGYFNFNTVVVKNGVVSENFFIMPDGTYFNSSSGSSKLEGSISPTGGNIKYTTGDGGFINFSGAFMENVSKFYTGTPPGNTPSLRADNWTFPNGETVYFDYIWNPITAASSTTPYCYWGGCSSANYFNLGSMLSKIRNNIGRSLTLSLSPVADSNTYITAYRITSVTDENGRSASYALPCTKLMCDSFSVTDSSNAVTRYEYVADANSPDPAIIERPNYQLRRWFTPDNASTPYQTVRYDELYRVKTTTDILGHQTSYYPGAVAGTEAWKRSDIATPLSEVSTNWFDKNNQPIKAANPLGMVRSSVYDAAGRVLRSVQPEGNAVEYSYDLRGNELTECQIAKGRVTWSALTALTEKTPQCSTAAGDLVATTAYTEGPTIRADQCVNMKTCNKPSYVVDAKGNRTNYAWDATHGGLLTETSGLNSAGVCALAGGVCPVTTYGYTAFTGTDGASFYLLTSKQELIASGVTTTTSYEYDASNHWALKSSVVDNGGLSLRSCYKFDAIGNLISITTPRAGLTSCP